MPAREVGRVASLWRYPVKSMASESLEETEVSWHGLRGDRRWAFVRDGVSHSGFPWLTMREKPLMAHYRPFFLEPTKPDSSPTLVRTPLGESLNVVDPHLARELGEGVRVIKHDVGIFDVFPLTLMSSQTVDGLAALTGGPVNACRFRPNFLVNATDGARFPEDGWVGKVIRIGSLRLRIDKRDKRCSLVSIDPETLVSDPNVLKTIVSEREACLGVYASTVTPGLVRVGDAVAVEE